MDQKDQCWLHGNKPVTRKHTKKINAGYMEMNQLQENRPKRLMLVTRKQTKKINASYKGKDQKDQC